MAPPGVARARQPTPTAPESQAASELPSNPASTRMVTSGRLLPASETTPSEGTLPHAESEQRTARAPPHEAELEGLGRRDVCMDICNAISEPPPFCPRLLVAPTLPALRGDNVCQDAHVSNARGLLASRYAASHPPRAVPCYSKTNTDPANTSPALASLPLTPVDPLVSPGAPHASVNPSEERATEYPNSSPGMGLDGFI